VKAVAPDIDANKAFSILKQLRDALLAINERKLYISGSWSHINSNYTKLVQEWPITDVSFHRWQESSLLGKILGRFKHDFVLKLEDPSFLVNVFRIFKMDRIISAWSIGKEEEAAFKAKLIAQSLAQNGSSTDLCGDLIQFSPSLFYFNLIEDVSYDEPFLFLHCGENVPRELKKIITDNNLEPYIEYTANH